MQTTHPPRIDLPDQDLRELREWTETNGWSIPWIRDEGMESLVSNPQGFDFWLQTYRCGLIQSDVLRQYDENEMQRMTESVVEEEEDEHFMPEINEETKHAS